MSSFVLSNILLMSPCLSSLSISTQGWRKKWKMAIKLMSTIQERVTKIGRSHFQKWMLPQACDSSGKTPIVSSSIWCLSSIFLAAKNIQIYIFLALIQLLPEIQRGTNMTMCISHWRVATVIELPAFLPFTPFTMFRYITRTLTPIFVRIWERENVEDLLQHLPEWRYKNWEKDEALEGPRK